MITKLAPLRPFAPKLAPLVRPKLAPLVRPKLAPLVPQPSKK